MMNELIQFLVEKKEFFTVFLFLFLSLRYLTISTAVYFLLWKLLPHKLTARKIQDAVPYKNQIWVEIKHSLISFLAMAIVCTPLFDLFASGKTAVYSNISDRSLLWIPAGVLIFFFWHDYYFYVLHRWLHNPKAFKRFHYIHHLSKVPTPYASHSFHWVEGALQILFIYPIVMFVPMHPWTFVIFMAVSAFFATWGHFNYELMPFKTWEAWWGTWVTTSTHHNMHHKFNNGNFGLYLRRWDRQYKTLNPRTEERFKQY